MSKIPEVFAIFEQKLAHVLSFTVVPLKSKDLKNALEEILTYFSSIVERASKAESRIAELEYQLEDWTNNGWAEDYKARIAELEATVEVGADIAKAYENRVSEIVALSNETVGKLNSRIAELEGFIDRLIEVGDWLNAMHEDGVFVDELNAARTSWKLAVSDWQAMPSHVTNPLDSQGIVTRNGGEG